MTNLTPETSHVPLNQLRFGHEADPPMNVRKQGREEDVDQLAASLAAIGLQQPLLIRRRDDGIFVRDGNRRLAALHRMRDAGTIAADVPVFCAESEGNDREIGLAANIERLPLHEIDQYEAFADLAAGGMTDKDISGRFGIEKKHVRRILALGRLSPAVREAWRSGEFDRGGGYGQGPDEVAKAFTLGQTHADQDRVLEKLRKSKQLYVHQVRTELGAGDRNAEQLMQFVGAKAYKAAGGAMVEDLFGKNHAIADTALLARLAADKMQSKCAELLDEGWGWASAETDLPNGARWSWQSVRGGVPTPDERQKIDELQRKIDALDADDEETDAEADRLQDEINAIEKAIEERGISAEDKARAGCIVSISYNGTLEVKTGVLKPEAKKAAAAPGSDGKAKDEGPTISDALARDLSTAMTKAAREAIQSDGKLALAALLAGFAAKYHDGNVPVRVSTSGLLPASGGEAYDVAFDRYRAMSIDELLVVAGGVAGMAMNLLRNFASDIPMKAAGVATLLNAIDPPTMNAALVRNFDAEDFFKRASAAVATAALREIFPAAPATLPKKKPELAAMAAIAAAENRWLPPEMRTAHYDGPGSKKAAPAEIPKTPARRAMEAEVEAANAADAPPAKKPRKAA